MLVFYLMLFFCTVLLYCFWLKPCIHGSQVSKWHFAFPGNLDLGDALLKHHRSAQNDNHICVLLGILLVFHLEKCARILPRCMYEPEQFPALIYRNDLPAVMLVFGSGKLVCTDCKTQEEVFRAVASLHSILEENMLISYRWESNSSRFIILLGVHQNY